MSEAYFGGRSPSPLEKRRNRRKGRLTDLVKKKNEADPSLITHLNELAWEISGGRVGKQPLSDQVSDAFLDLTDAEISLFRSASFAIHTEIQMLLDHLESRD